MHYVPSCHCEPVTGVTTSVDRVTRFSRVALVWQSVERLAALPFPGLLRDGPPMARLQRFRAAFICRRQRRPAILPAASLDFYVFHVPPAGGLPRQCAHWLAMTGAVIQSSGNSCKTSSCQNSSRLSCCFFQGSSGVMRTAQGGIFTDSGGSSSRTKATS